MPRPASDKRDRLIDAAAELAHTHGFERTTIGDIADNAGVPTGSVYYYFKTKDDVGHAIVEAMRARYGNLLEGWGAGDDARERLVAYIDWHLDQATLLAQHGSPVGSLCAELRRHSPQLGEEAAALPRMIIAWAAGQFHELGFSAEAADARATHLVTGLEGAASLANALGTTEPLERETNHLKRWITATRTP